MFDNLYVLAAIAVGLFTIIIALIVMMKFKSPPPGKPRRFCPLCNSSLADHETLKGLIVDNKPPQKILIRGCSRCAPSVEEGTW